MTYHSNHCWCSNSCWKNKNFDGEAMVIIEKTFNTYSIDKYKNEIINPDFKNLFHEEEKFSQSIYDNLMSMLEIIKNKPDLKEKFYDNEELKEGIVDGFKQSSMKNTIILNKEVVDWLNVNIKDKKGTNKKTPLEERKGWAIYSEKESIEDSKNRFTIFFHRQIDALKFIKTFSVFKEPTIYFDYFHSEASEISIDKALKILNHLEYNIKIEDLILNNETNFIKDLSPYDYKLLDWEKEDDEDDCDLTKEEIKNLIDSLNNI